MVITWKEQARKHKLRLLGDVVKTRVLKDGQRDDTGAYVFHDGDLITNPQINTLS